MYKKGFFIKVCIFIKFTFKVFGAHLDKNSRFFKGKDSSSENLIEIATKYTPLIEMLHRRVVLDCGLNKMKMKDSPLRGRSSMPSLRWIPAVRGFLLYTSPCTPPAYCRRNKPEHYIDHQVSSHFNTLLKEILAKSNQM